MRTAAGRKIIHYQHKQQTEEINDDAANLFSQTQLNNLSRKLNLLKEAAQLLASRLKEKNFLKKGTTMAFL